METCTVSPERSHHCSRSVSSDVLVIFFFLSKVELQVVKKKKGCHSNQDPLIRSVLWLLLMNFFYTCRLCYIRRVLKRECLRGVCVCGGV